MISSYFICQSLVIIGLFLTGFIFVRMIQSKADILECSLLAYETGLAIWGVGGYLILISGIPYNLVSVGVLYLIVFGTLLFIYLKRNRNNHNIVLLEKSDIKLLSIAMIIVFLAAILCCSGFLKIAVSNDSYYYYSVYPQTIVIEGKYLTSFDVFLTDVGQTTAIINCLPWFFGFEETYGIQMFLGFNLIAMFYHLIYKISGNKHLYASLFTLLLVSFSPFIIMTRWALANVYFMAFLFGLCFVTYLGKENGRLIILALFISMLSMIRMEGGMMAGLFILCVCGITEYENRDIGMYLVIPVGVTQLLYYLTVFMKLSVNPLYSFLDFSNAMIMIAFVIAIALYVFIFRNRILMDIQKYYKILVVFGLVLGNILLCFINSERYLGNLKFLILNIYLKNGWGYFGVFMVLSALIILALRMMIYIKTGNLGQIYFFTFLTVNFVLFTLAVCWARDGSLRIGIGDSGNRVLMQIVPFAVFAVAEELISIIKELNNQYD